MFVPTSDLLYMLQLFSNALLKPSLLSWSFLFADLRNGSGKLDYSHAKYSLRFNKLTLWNLQRKNVKAFQWGSTHFDSLWNHLWSKQEEQRPDQTTQEGAQTSWHISVKRFQVNLCNSLRDKITLETSFPSLICGLEINLTHREYRYSWKKFTEIGQEFWRIFHFEDILLKLFFLYLSFLVQRLRFRKSLSLPQGHKIMPHTGGHQIPSISSQL